MAVVNQPKYQSQPPSQIVPDLADQGIYLASESTFYRILRDRERQHHRGRAQQPSRRQPTTHGASGPNQVWMWDITWLPGPVKGQFFYAYMIEDLFSRDLVAQDVWSEETAAHASALVKRAVLSERVAGQPLVLHSDNGSPMKAATMLETLYKLGITPSRSRPRVSNDNPYAESLFRTCKYRPDFPQEGFADLEAAQRWLRSFVTWYKYKHHHSALKYLTPHQRHTGQTAAIMGQRQTVYEAARERHPQRWNGRKTRDWTLPEMVWLNPERENRPQSCDTQEKQAS
jgi:putative transposase